MPILRTKALISRIASPWKSWARTGLRWLGHNPSTCPRARLPGISKEAVRPVSDGRRHVLTFARCCYPLQRFDSDTERRFAVLVDADQTVAKWMKPGKAQCQIEYRSGELYEPDFVVELTDHILICEIKAESQLADPVVQAKASAATKWCRSATEHATSNGGEPRAYVLITDHILANASLAGLAAKFTVA